MKIKGVFLEENMAVEEFYNQFEGLDSHVSQLDSNVKARRNEIGQLERSLETKQFMQKVLAGLKITPKQSDPGKYGPAFYFVAEITQGDIIRTGEPSLYKPCPECKTDQPVLMYYEQTEDSPWGDTWEKKAFIMCRKDGVHTLAYLSNSYRF